MPSTRPLAPALALLAAMASSASANTPPVSHPDAYTTTQGKNLSVDKPGVLGNDVDTDPLTAILVDSSQATGVLKLYADGSFEYEVADGFFGTDVFTYKANDGTQDGNVTTVTFTVDLGSGPSKFTDPALFQAALAAKGYCAVTQGFESDADWGLARTTIVDGPFGLDFVNSRGVVWSSNSLANEITTSNGAAKTGQWGVYSYPHADYAHGIGDGVRGVGLSRMVAIGGWVRTNTPPAKVYLYIDGSTQPISFGAASSLSAGPATFFGYLDPAGFDAFEFREVEGVATDAKYVFFDDFTMAYDLTDDCNGNQVPDACDIALGTSTDCDEDGVPDDCGPDCDGNQVSDVCDVLQEVLVDSGTLSPISFASPQSVAIPQAPSAVSPVGLRFWTVAEIGQTSEYFRIDVNGVPVGVVFNDSYASTCNPHGLDYDQLVLDPSTFNAALNGGTAVVNVVPTSSVGASCSNSHVRIEVAYTGVAAADANGNGVPDSCETVCQTDLGYGGPGASTFSICGGDLSSGTTATLRLTNAPAQTAALLLAGVQANPTAFYGGLLVPLPPVLQVLLTTDANGEITIPGVPGGLGPVSVYAQFAVVDAAAPLGVGLSNALRIDLKP